LCLLVLQDCEEVIRLPDSDDSCGDVEQLARFAAQQCRELAMNLNEKLNARPNERPANHNPAPAKWPAHRRFWHRSVPPVAKTKAPKPKEAPEREPARDSGFQPARAMTELYRIAG
jgi:hypothetical protein